MRLRMLWLLAAVLGLAVACGVPQGGPVKRIRPPLELSDTIPTTTSTTTVVSSTVVETSTTVVAPTTTVLAESVQLFFIAGGQLTSVTVPLPSPAVPVQVISRLQSGPPDGDLGAGLRSAIPAGGPIGVTVDGSGVAYVNLPPAFFDTITTTDQRLAIGQIVFTLTSRPGIGQVSFLMGGVPIPVVRGNGESAAAGQPMAARDYQVLLATSTSNDSTTTLTSTTTTTRPSGP